MILSNDASILLSVTNSDIHGGEFTIPNSVTQISNGAFANCTSLTQITIPNSVTQIGEMAFRDCKSLTEITIPNAVTQIGNGAFAGCTSLKAIVIDDSNQQAYEAISHLIPTDFQHLIIPYSCWSKINDAQNLALLTKPIGLTFLAQRLPETSVNLIEQMDKNLHDAIYRLPLPRQIMHLMNYNKALQDSIGQLLQKQDYLCHRIYAIDKLHKVIQKNEEAIARAAHKERIGFFYAKDVNVNQANVRIDVAKKLIKWLDTDREGLLSLTAEEKALLSIPGNSIPLILGNYKIDYSMFLQAPPPKNSSCSIM